MIQTIDVKLLDEDLDVARPIYARHIIDDIYEIIQQDYDRDSEKWEYEPGEFVHCVMVDFFKKPTLLAIFRTSNPLNKKE